MMCDNLNDEKKKENSKRENKCNNLDDMKKNS